MFKTMKVMIIMLVVTLAMSTMTFAAEKTSSDDSKAWYEVVTDTVVNTATRFGEGCVLAGKGIAKGACSVGNVIKSGTGVAMTKVGAVLVKTGTDLHEDAVRYFEETEE